MNKLVIIFLAVCVVSTYAAVNRVKFADNDDGIRSQSYLEELERKANEFITTLNNKKQTIQSPGVADRDNADIEIANNIKQEYEELKRRSRTRE